MPEQPIPSIAVVVPPDPATMTPEEANRELAVLRGSPDHPMWNKTAIGYQAAHERATLLYQRAAEGSPEPPAAPSDPTAPAVPEGVELPEGLTWSPVAPALVDALATAFEAPAADVFNLVAEAAHRLGQSHDQEATLKALRQEWGPAFADNILAAQAVVARAATVYPTLLRDLDETGLGNDPVLVRRLAAVGKPLRAAQVQKAAILADTAHPYHDRNKPGHVEAVEEVLRLNETIHGREIVKSFRGPR